MQVRFKPLSVPELLASHWPKPNHMAKPEVREEESALHPARGHGNNHTGMIGTNSSIYHKR